jgi:hypothetical protein
MQGLIHTFFLLFYIENVLKERPDQTAGMIV